MSTCIGTDQMSPKRFGTQGNLAFSFGNVAQDEGSAMAQYAWSRGWKTAGLATNTCLVYFKNVVTAFEKRFKQLGGKITDKESYATGQNNVQTAVGRMNSHKAAVYVTSTAFSELPALVSGLRALHNNTPILNSWAGDGTYWNPNNPKVTNYYAVTYASVFGDDPSKAIRRLISSMTAANAAPGTGGFLGGAQTIDGLYVAINRAHGSLKGLALANQLVKFHNVKVLGGEISFSKKLHTVHGRTYRVIEIQNNQAKRVGLVTAKVIPSPAIDQTMRRPGDTLRASSVSRSYEGVQALQDVSLELRRGEVVGLIGPNGAGKSTLVNLLTGFDFPSSGTVQLGERDITRWSSHRRARAGIARSFQHSRSFRTLSVRENVEVSALGVGARTSVARRRADELLELLGLTELAETRADSLSHGTSGGWASPACSPRSPPSC